MADQSPHVSVFHFTSRISSAKIRKYKLATERGMAVRAPSDQPSASPAPAQATPATQTGPQTTTFLMQSGSPSSAEPPSKKQRLRLNVRQPSGDSIAVAQNGQPSGYRIRYSENMTVDANNKLSIQTFPEPKPSPPRLTNRQPLAYFQHAPKPLLQPPSASRSTSASTPAFASASAPGPAPRPAPAPAPTSAPAPAQAAAPAPVPTPTPAAASSSNKQAEYGANFASYYITGDDDDEPPPPPKKPAAVSRVPALPPPQARVPPGPAQAPPFQQTLPPPPPQHPHHHPHHPHPHEPRPNHQMFPPQQHHQPPAQMMTTARPSVDVHDDIRRGPVPQYPDTVANMIRKIEILSEALTNFGGVPAVPTSLPKNVDVQRALALTPALPTNAGKRTAAVDNFLAMFGDDDSDDDTIEEKQSNSDGNQEDAANGGLVKAHRSLDRMLEDMGVPDGPLSYGIQFIQTALKSWAKQRLNSQYAQHYHLALQRAIQAQTQPVRRGPGRPRKFDAWDEERFKPVVPPPNIQMLLSSTPEGAVIIAFQGVLDSGCLQVNALMPVELSQALRHLYLQIDRLINQGATAEPKWQCMSYGAQIKAHRAKVARWKDQQERAQEELARQQQIAQQQVMRQMALSAQRQQAAPQPMQAHGIKLERSEGSQQAPQQLYSSPYAAHQSATKPSHGSSEHTGPSPMSTPGGRGMRPIASSTEQKTASKESDVDGAARTVSALDRTKLSTPSFLSRSGQSLKFSFLPENEQAIKVFGEEAFANASTGSRGANRSSSTSAAAAPTTAETLFKAPAATLVVNGTARAPLLVSDGGQPDGGAHKDTESSASTIEIPDSVDTKSTQDDAPKQTDAQPIVRGFTAVNAMTTSRPDHETDAAAGASANAATHDTAMQDVNMKYSADAGQDKSKSTETTGDFAAQTGNFDQMEID